MRAPRSGPRGSRAPCAAPASPAAATLTPRGGGLSAASGPGAHWLRTRAPCAAGAARDADWSICGRGRVLPAGLRGEGKGRERRAGNRRGGEGRGGPAAAAHLRPSAVLWFGAGGQAWVSLRPGVRVAEHTGRHGMGGCPKVRAPTSRLECPRSAFGGAPPPAPQHQQEKLRRRRIWRALGMRWWRRSCPTLEALTSPCAAPWRAVSPGRLRAGLGGSERLWFLP